MANLEFVLILEIYMATPKDEYPMPVADLLVDGASGTKSYLLWMNIQVIIKYSL